MLDQEQTLFKVDKVATHLAKSEAEVDEMMFTGKMRYSVRLQGEFFWNRLDPISDGENDPNEDGGIVRKFASLLSRQNEFLIEDFQLICPDNREINLEDAGLLRLEDDGFWCRYSFKSNPPRITKDDLFISREEIERYKLTIASPPAVDTQINIPDKGGRPPGQLMEAVEKLYCHLRDQGNTEILRAGKVKEFLTRLQECLSGTDEVSKYVSLRVDKVDLKNTAKAVRTMGNKDSRGKTTGERFYSQGRASTILSELRRKYPLQ